MKIKLLISASFFTIIGILSAVANAETSEKPPKPSEIAPPLQSLSLEPICIDCGDSFDTSSHKELLDKLAKNIYLSELRHALYFQDSIHQFESRAHFDNCDFDSAITYINDLLNETNEHVQKAQSQKEKEDKEIAMKKAYFSLGQAIHAVQDFYAHSNFVELMVPKAKSADDLIVVEPWTSEGKAIIAKLAEQKLLSGYVFWGLPQKCEKDSISHSDLAKDSPDTKSGKIKIAHFQNQSQYKVALFLARKTSVALMKYAFKRWPLMKEMGGSEMAFEVLIDRRGI